MPTNPVIRAIIFDMGGVLLKTTDKSSRRALAQKYGLTNEELELLVFGSPSSIRAELGEISDQEHWRHVARELHIPPEELPGFIDEFWEGDQLDRELVNFIGTLKQKYRTGLLSNAWSNARQSISRRYPLMLTVFDELVFSAEVGLRKPDPKIYGLLLDRMNVQADEAVFVDDFAHNIEGARAVGLHSIHYSNTPQIMGALRSLLLE